MTEFFLFFNDDGWTDYSSRAANIRSSRSAVANEIIGTGYKKEAAPVLLVSPHTNT
jgi:hypothetical protein